MMGLPLEVKIFVFEFLLNIFHRLNELLSVPHDEVRIRANIQRTGDHQHAAKCNSKSDLNKQYDSFLSRSIITS